MHHPFARTTHTHSISPHQQTTKGLSGATDGGLMQSFSDATNSKDPIAVWTPHDVAEWLYMQNTKKDYTTTFLTKSIDGPALLGLTREQMAEWQVKPVDITAILKGIEMLRRISEGDIGWQPAADDAKSAVLQPVPPPEPKKPGGRKPKPPPVEKPSESYAMETSEAVSFEEVEGGSPIGGPSPAPESPGGADTWALTGGATSSTMGGTGRKKKKKSSSAMDGDEGDDSMALSGAAAAGSPNYLKKVMGELHQTERVPLWKEEMVERVKRAATAREQQLLRQKQAAKAKSMSLSSSSAPPTARHGRTGGAGEGDPDDMAESVKAPRESLGGSEAESGHGTVRSQQAREIERKLFWYQDAIHEQELQQQLLDQKIRGMVDEVHMIEEKRLAENPTLRQSGAANLYKEMGRAQTRQRNKLAKALQVSEERVADAERLNKATVESINKMRKGRADFLRQVAHLDERVAVMVADMKHFAAAAHVSLDEKEKVESRLKRQQYDYRNEIAHTEHVFDMLQNELAVLEERISHGHAAEEEFLQRKRQAEYQSVKRQREEDSRREMKLGYLQNHVRGQEMDFQRLHRIMGVKFTPEKPDSVQDIVKASLSHEQRNASLLHYVGVQNAEVEELVESVRALEEQEKELIVAVKQADEDEVIAAAEAVRSTSSASHVVEGIEKRDADLKKLCPIVETLSTMSGASAAVESEDGGILSLKGCRPDTLTDYLRLIDVAIKTLRERAESLPTASGNEWLRDFLAYQEVATHPTVTEIRKELETAAQKVKEQKEAKQMLAAASASGEDDEGGKRASVVE